MSDIVGKHTKQYIAVTFKGVAHPRIVLLLYDNRTDATNDVLDDFVSVYQPVRNLFPSNTVETITAVRTVKGEVPILDFRLFDEARREHLDNV